MPKLPGPFACGQIALGLSRLPGRQETDEEEAYRILAQIIAWFNRGQFADDEVVALYGDLRQPRPVKTLPADAQSELGSLRVWRDAIMLTYPAAKRFVEASTVATAARLLAEWFTDLPANAACSPAEAGVTAAVSEPKAAVKETRSRGKPGPKPKLRDCLAAKMLDDLTWRRRTPEQLEGDKLNALASAYGGSPNTAYAARKDALQRFSEFQNSSSELAQKNNSEH